MHTPDTAARAIVGVLSPLSVETVDLLDAPGRVAGRDVISPLDLPAWANSAMDGYAVRSADLDRDGCELTIVEEIAAGAFPTRTLDVGECARIFTGAPVPDGADGVIRQEHTTRVNPTLVRIDDRADAGRHVRPRGEDIRKDDIVVTAGSEVGSAQIGLLASIAEARVDVHRQPVVAILGSGDEIAGLDERDAILAGRKIASSNTYTLMSLVRAAGAKPVDLGIARDDPEDLRRRIVGPHGADLLVTTAGVSVGEHDFLRDVLGELRLEESFWRIRMRPGAPVGFGLVGALGGIPWIGLPGNPVSTMVTFELFARPAIRRLAGHTNLFRRTTPVTSAQPVRLGPPLRHFLRVILQERDERMWATLTGPQGSGILTSMARADALMIVREDQPEVAEGTVLEAIVLDDPRHVPEPPF